jgi:hypothetical protein
VQLSFSGGMCSVRSLQKQVFWEQARSSLHPAKR